MPLRLSGSPTVIGRFQLIIHALIWVINAYQHFVLRPVQLRPQCGRNWVNPVELTTAPQLADGKTAFWLNGNWAWPNLEEAGAEPDDEYGFLPFFMSNDEDDFANQQIQGSPSKQIMLDGQIASENEQAAAKEFLNWIVYSEIGQQMLVYTCSLIPPFHNNPYEPTDPLSRAIYEKVQSGGAFNASAIVPNDHWSILGAAMQKYLADRSDRDELIESIEEYWAEQK